jgi:hypothetical protein
MTISLPFRGAFSHKYIKPLKICLVTCLLIGILTLLSSQCSLLTLESRVMIRCSGMSSPTIRVPLSVGTTGNAFSDSVLSSEFLGSEKMVQCEFPWHASSVKRQWDILNINGIFLVPNQVSSLTWLLDFDVLVVRTRPCPISELGSHDLSAPSSFLTTTSNPTFQHN